MTVSQPRVKVDLLNSGEGKRIGTGSSRKVPPVNPPIEVGAVLSSLTAPYLIGYDTSVTPWKASTNFLPTMPNSPCHVAKANDDFFAYGMTGDPYIRVFNISDRSELSLSGMLPSSPVVDLAFDDTNGYLYLMGDGAQDSRRINLSTGVVDNPNSGGTMNSGSGVAVRPDGGHVMYLGDVSAVYMRIYKTAGGTTGINGIPTTPCGKGRYRDNLTCMVPFSNAPYLKVYGVGELNYFDNGAPSTTLTGAGKSVAYSPNGQRAVAIGMNEVIAYNVGAGTGAGHTQVASYPVTWPDPADVELAVYSDDNSRLLFSNGQVFDVTVVPFLEVTGPSDMPTSGTGCDFVSMPLP